VAFFILAQFPWGFGAILMACSAGLYYELNKMGQKLLPGYGILVKVVCTGGVIYSLYQILHVSFPHTLPNIAVTPLQPWAPWIYFLFLGILLKKENLENLFPIVLVFYPLLGILSVLDLAYIGGSYDLKPLIFLLINVWCADAFAYFGGSIMKGPKLAPRISPNKTISGWITALVGIGLASTVMNIMWWEWSYFHLALWILMIWLSSSLGDLFESVIKRQVGVKDSGVFLPGHGGFLDRLDSIIYSAPFAVYLFNLN
jgi:CDP-diglyceride synthetase